MLVAGGYNNLNIVKTAEVYSLSTGIWEPTGSMNSARVITELYNSSIETWFIIDRIGNARAWHIATVLKNGKVLIAGGFNGRISLNSVQLYDPITKAWSTTGSMNNSRHGHTASLLPDRKILVIGGLNVDTPLNNAELYDPVTGIWTHTIKFTTPRAWHTASVLKDGTVLIAGGSNINALPSAILYC